jgi:hypothetical protein
LIINGYNDEKYEGLAGLTLSLKLEELGLNGIDFGDKVSVIDRASDSYDLFGLRGNVHAIKFDKIKSLRGFNKCLSL